MAKIYYQCWPRFKCVLHHSPVWKSKCVQRQPLRVYFVKYQKSNWTLSKLPSPHVIRSCCSSSNRTKVVFEWESPKWQTRCCVCFRWCSSLSNICRFSPIDPTPAFICEKLIRFSCVLHLYSSYKLFSRSFLMRSSCTCRVINPDKVGICDGSVAFHLWKNDYLKLKKNVALFYWENWHFKKLNLCTVGAEII